MGDETAEVDPERARFEALLAAQRRGTAGEAEREELALYAADDPERQRAIADNERVARIGKGWLERVERDDALQRIEFGRRARIERGGGLALAGVGFVLQFPLPAIGAILMGMGVLVILYSLVRVRVAAHRTDPYKDVVR